MTSGHQVQQGSQQPAMQGEVTLAVFLLFISEKPHPNPQPFAFPSLLKMATRFF